MVVGILCLDYRHDCPKFLDIVPYQQSVRRPLPCLLAFRGEIVSVYLAKHPLSRNRSGRLLGRILPAKRRFNDEVRYDQVDHFQSRFEKQKWCGYCGKNTRKCCSKWGVRLKYILNIKHLNIAVIVMYYKGVERAHFYSMNKFLVVKHDLFRSLNVKL